jgi:hypothetical protein
LGGYGVVGANEDAFVAAYTFFCDVYCFAAELDDFNCVFAVPKLLQNGFAQKQAAGFDFGAFLHAAEGVFALDGDEVFYARIKHVENEVGGDSACAGNSQGNVVFDV